MACQKVCKQGRDDIKVNCLFATCMNHIILKHSALFCSITVAYKEQIVQNLPELVSRLNLPFRLPVELQDVFLTSDACLPNTCYVVHRLLLLFIVLVH